MNIVKLLDGQPDILTDMPIWINREDGNVVITVAFTGKLRIVELSNIKYICPLDKFT